MKIYKAVYERENKCKELHKEMNLNVGKSIVLARHYQEKTTKQ